MYLVCVRACSVTSVCLTLCDSKDCSLPGFLCPRGSPGKNTGVGRCCPPPGGLPDPGIEPASLMSPAWAGEFFTTGTAWAAPVYLVDTP